MSLPIFQSSVKELSLLQTQWATQINPLLSNPISNGAILKSVVLASGANVINHKLGRTLQGWFIVRQRSTAAVYDTQDSNTIPDLTLNLTSSHAVTVDLYVF
jgi:hypothetical protein